MKEIKIGSLFDGSGGFPLAGIMYGMNAAWASEVEPYPIRVTTKRIPFMKHLGDINKMNGAEIEPVDVITGGSPCQDMSVAGKRAGLDGERSGLFREQIRIIKEMREATNGKYPRFMLWENVPGALSSNKGADFRCVLEETARIKDAGFDVPMPEKNKWNTAGLIMGDDFSIGWRILDAQYWGVPQRRRRIFLVADFGGTSSGEILFKREGLSWHFTQSRKPWQTATGNTETGIDPTGEKSNCLTPWDVQSRRIFTTDGEWPSLYGGEGGGHGYALIPTGEPCVAFDTYNMVPVGDKTVTLRSGSEHNYAPVFQRNNPIYSIDREAMNSGYEFDRAPGIDESGMAYTLKATGPGGVAHPTNYLFENHSQDTRYKGPLEVAQPVTATYGMGGNNQPFVVSVPFTMQIRCGCEGGGKGPFIQTDQSATLSTHNVQTLFQPVQNMQIPSGCNWDGQQTAPTLTANNAGGNQRMPDKSHFNCVLQTYGIGSYASNAMKSDNPHSGIYEADTSRTLDLNGGNPACHQGGMAICEPVCAEVFHCTSEVDKTPVLKARDYKDPHVVAFEPEVANEYIVRRLTPLEYARLQGFPDWWTADLGTREEDITEEDMQFWREVFETHREVIAKTSKPKTDKQIRKWLTDPNSDSAEYKMWGNGVALPCVLYVMEGIADVLNKERCDNQPIVCEFQRGVCCYPIEDCENCPVREE